MPMPNRNQRTLNRIVKLIYKDVTSINRIGLGREVRWKQLPKESVEKLVAYAEILNSLIDTEKKVKASTKKKLEKLSNEDLVKLIQTEEKRMK